VDRKEPSQAVVERVKKFRYENTRAIEAVALPIFFESPLGSTTASPTTTFNNLRIIEKVEILIPVVFVIRKYI
jgi:hypothetical protein